MYVFCHPESLKPVLMEAWQGSKKIKPRSWRIGQLQPKSWNQSNHFQIVPETGRSDRVQNTGSMDGTRRQLAYSGTWNDG